jgi:8-oxo-dGTP diphosphatase
MKYNKVYHPPIVTVDLVLFQVEDGKLTVLLHNRPQNPFKGQWALPGGYMPRGETTRQALQRIIQYKVGLDTHSFPYLEQLQTFDSTARDPRGHALSVVYLGTGYRATPTRTAAECAMFVVDALSELPFDHRQIIESGRKHLANEIAHTDLVKSLLPPLFTLTELQSVYEAILGHALDKRNFRRRLLKLAQLVETDKLKYHATSRPAKLYKFKTKSIGPLASKID